MGFIALFSRQKYIRFTFRIHVLWRIENFCKFLSRFSYFSTKRKEKSCPKKDPFFMSLPSSIFPPFHKESFIYLTSKVLLTRISDIQKSTKIFYTTKISWSYLQKSYYSEKQSCYVHSNLFKTVYHRYRHITNIL